MIVSEPKCFPVRPGKPCSKCGLKKWSAPEITSFPLTLISTEGGKADFAKGRSCCQGRDPNGLPCDGVQMQKPEDMLMVGLWPVSVDGSRFSTVYTQDVLDFWESLSKSCPGTAYTNFLRVLDRRTKERGGVRLSPKL